MLPCVMCAGDRVPNNLPIDGHSFRRVEVLTGTPRRRRWTDAEKAAIVAESLAPGARTSEIALRHGLHRFIATSSMTGGASFAQPRMPMPAVSPPISFQSWRKTTAVRARRRSDNASVGPSRDRQQTDVNGLSGAACQALMGQKASDGCSLIHIVSDRPHAIAGDRH